MERDVTNTNDAIALYNQVQALEVNYQGVTLDSIPALADEKIKTGLYLRGEYTAAHKREYNDEYRGGGKPILESKSINDLPKVADTRSYRYWNRR